MLSNSPKVRAVLYAVAIVAQVAAFFVRAADKSGAYSTAVQDTANFVGGMAGLTSLGNLTTTQAPKLVSRVRRWRARRDRPARV